MTKLDLLDKIEDYKHGHVSPDAMLTAVDTYTAARIADSQCYARPQAEPLPHDIPLLRNLWHSRNPTDEFNADTGENMFWGTLLMVFDEYNKAMQQKRSGNGA